MANWTIDHVIDWLEREGFGQFSNNFKNRRIDGASLFRLNNETIRQLFSLPNQSDVEQENFIEQFKEKLFELKTQRVSSTSTTTYTKNITLSNEKIGTNSKFFHNSSFRTHFQQHLSNTHHINCQIRLLETQEILLKLTGNKPNVKAARESIDTLFKSIQMKIYDDEEIDQQMIYWSQHLTSDSIIPVLQQIMNNQNIFTLWEKTAMFYGYFKVTYFAYETFTVSEDRINEILSDEIRYIENLSMPEEKTRNFMNHIEEFIGNKQETTELAIVYCKYPYKFDMKISLFGRKKLVQKMKKQLQLICHKHTLKNVYLKLTDYHLDYLLNNCIEELKDIENEYQDDHVKIRIRLKEFTAPQYLSEKIKQQINELITEKCICRFQRIEHSILLTDNQKQKIYQIARTNYCQIESIEIKSDLEVYTIPNALSSESHESDQFDSWMSVRKLSVLNSSIEVHLTNQSSSIPRDFTVISSPTDAAEEGVEFMSDYGYIETKTSRKMLFVRWSPMVQNDDKTNKKLSKSIEDYLSSVFHSMTIYNGCEGRIVFLTNGWNNVDIEQKLFVDCFLNEMKKELKLRKVKWRIMLIFNNQQMEFYKEFYQKLIQLQQQSNSNVFAQFSCPISTMEIIVSTILSIKLLKKCQEDITTYINKNISTNQILTDQFNLRQWNQHTLNVLYNYCLGKSVLLKLDLTDRLQIEFLGSQVDVKKSLEKYKLMNEIIEQKSTSQTSIREKKKRPEPIDYTGYNIYFSFCQSNHVLCDRILACLINDGYSVCSSSSKTLIDRSDIVLIGFSQTYSQTDRSMIELNYVKSSGKKLIAFVIREDTSEGTWLSSLTLTELFYDFFDSEIDLEFRDDFDLEYDRLLVRLLNHTKPGITGRTYPQSSALPGIKGKIDDDDNLEEGAFSQPSLALQTVTREQRAERERKYKEDIAKRLENEKISDDDDLDDLVSSLHRVTDYLNEILKGNNPDTDFDDRYLQTEQSEELKNLSLAGTQDFLNCIKRWLSRIPNVIKHTLPPFTPTGDINDAIFIIHRSPDDHKFERVYIPFDHSPCEKYFSAQEYHPGAFFTQEQSHAYFQKLVKSTKPTNDMKMEIENDTAWETISLSDEANENDLKTPEQIRKLEELDNPNRIWKKPRVSQEFIQRKIRNILELKELCEKET